MLLAFVKLLLPLLLVLLPLLQQGPQVATHPAGHLAHTAAATAAAAAPPPPLNPAEIPSAAAAQETHPPAAAAVGVLHSNKEIGQAPCHCQHHVVAPACNTTTAAAAAVLGTVAAHLHKVATAVDGFVHSVAAILLLLYILLLLLLLLLLPILRTHCHIPLLHHHLLKSVNTHQEATLDHLLLQQAIHLTQQVLQAALD